MLFLSVVSLKHTCSAFYITLSEWLKVLIGRDTFTFGKFYFLSGINYITS